MSWKNITINASQIEKQTERGVLIKVPGTDYKFWHPSKLLRSNGARYSFGYTDEFKFRLFKQGQGRYNKFEKFDEHEVSAEEIEGYFAGNIRSAENEHKSNRIHAAVEITEPEYRAPEQSEVADDLRI